MDCAVGALELDARSHALLGGADPGSRVSARKEAASDDCSDGRVGVATWDVDRRSPIGGDDGVAVSAVERSQPHRRREAARADAELDQTDADDGVRADG